MSTCFNPIDGNCKQNTFYNGKLFPNVDALFPNIVVNVTLTLEDNDTTS